MKQQYPLTFGMASYVVAVLIILHWALICSFDEFLHLYKYGFQQETIDALPFFLKPLYKGKPNLITLICFMLFTFSAFLLIQQKRKSYFYVSISSFVMIAYLFIFLIKA